MRMIKKINHAIVGVWRIVATGNLTAEHPV